MVTAASTSQLITTTQNQTAVNWSSSRRDQKLWRKNNWRKTLQASQRWDFTWLWRCEGLSSNVEPQHDARRRLHVRVAPPAPSLHPPPSILKPNGPCGPLPAQLGSLPDISESFPAPGARSAPIAAAALWQNVFSPLRLIELKVVHIHCCCFWTAASS